MSEERRAKRDPGDPEGPYGDPLPGPRPMAGTAAEAAWWDGAVDRLLEAIFPGSGDRSGETETGG